MWVIIIKRFEYYRGLLLGIFLSLFGRLFVFNDKLIIICLLFLVISASNVSLKRE